VKSRFGDTIAVVCWHPFASDTFSINPGDSIRLARFPHVQGEPYLAMDGYYRVAMPGQPADYYQTFLNAISRARSLPSYASVVATGEADSTSGRVFVQVTLDEIPPGSRPTLYCLVLEDSLAAGPATFNHVPRAFVPGPEGIPLALARRDTLFDTLEFSTAGTRPENLSAVLFVEDATSDTVMQAYLVRRFTLREEQ